MGNLGYGHFFLTSSLFNKTYISILIFFSQSRKERKAGKWHLFPTKTGKTIAVMQGLCPLFLSGTVVLRSKLRPAGTGKKQPSFLRLASRQGKPGKPLTPRGWLYLHRIYLHHTDTSCKNDTCNTLIINMLLHSATSMGGVYPHPTASWIIFSRNAPDGV